MGTFAAAEGWSFVYWLACCNFHGLNQESDAGTHLNHVWTHAEGNAQMHQTIARSQNLMSISLANIQAPWTQIFAARHVGSGQPWGRAIVLTGRHPGLGSNWWTDCQWREELCLHARRCLVVVFEVFEVPQIINWGSICKARGAMCKHSQTHAIRIQIISDAFRQGQSCS